MSRLQLLFQLELDFAFGHEFGADTLQDTFGLAVGEVVGIVVSGRDFNQPVDLYYRLICRGEEEKYNLLYLDIGDGSDIVL